ncbi:uncharacterized protein BT62DRAFT_311011 [Guyanagaster necrorhizus]|uniref:Uncharacterized protein n=1 Tax=Guyanagaster necrorhizus TaxID=856835 RepID=A0A9P7VQ86_9AGAR|nr:uncharacterized protein BT62DRAFT_311011 [Guyanagaster necrorhizus MCA 3950]KAG7444041.1 hypothetical protein BT62DRAFT_311011 [Guyanagaster necrorhizus MCA 3950]
MFRKCRRSLAFFGTLHTSPSTLHRRFPGLSLRTWTAHRKLVPRIDLIASISIAPSVFIFRLTYKENPAYQPNCHSPVIISSFHNRKRLPAVRMYILRQPWSGSRLCPRW